jgi:hypothetical protein
VAGSRCSDERFDYLCPRSDLHGQTLRTPIAAFFLNPPATSYPQDRQVISISGDGGVSMLMGIC